MSFDTLGLSEKVVAAVKAVGYETPTPIQAEAIPHVLAQRDVLGLAQTGTGKTASFTLPMLTLLERGRARARMPRTLVLEPTRELAAQVAESFERYGTNHKLTVALLIGGVSFDEQDKKITRGADVLIATPGRLLDHFERGRLLLTGVEILVIDEADRMLDMGFIPDIERIAKLLPPVRQTLFFSATMPPEISRLADRFLTNPVRVEVSRPASTADTVEQRLVASGEKPPEKRATLRRLLEEAQNLRNAIVFCNRKRDVATLSRSLERHGFSAGALHGDMDQHARLKMLENFREGNVAILVASDVAARGLDIPAVSHIFNFDVPTHPEDYVHRIGRTGRAGRSGEAFTIVAPADMKHVTAIEKLIGKEIAWTGEKPAEDDGETRGASRRRPTSRSRTGRGKAEARAEDSVETKAREETERPERPERDEAEDRRPPERAKPAERRRESRSGGDRGASAPQKPRSGPASARGEDRRRDQQEEAVGFRDHIPAFLLRPVKLPKPTEEAAESESEDETESA